VSSRLGQNLDDPSPKPCLWTARAIGAPLFIVSAGLGLVAQETQVPSYNLTVAPHSSDSMATRFEDRGAEGNKPGGAEVTKKTSRRSTG
jgi:hypothetical protein